MLRLLKLLQQYFVSKNFFSIARRGAFELIRERFTWGTGSKWVFYMISFAPCDSRTSVRDYLKSNYWLTLHGTLHPLALIGINAVLSHFNASFASAHSSAHKWRRLLRPLVQRGEIIGDQTIQVFVPSQGSLMQSTSQLPHLAIYSCDLDPREGGG